MLLKKHYLYSVNEMEKNIYFRFYIVYLIAYIICVNVYFQF